MFNPSAFHFIDGPFKYSFLWSFLLIDQSNLSIDQLQSLERGCFQCFLSRHLSTKCRPWQSINPGQREGDGNGDKETQTQAKPVVVLATQAMPGHLRQRQSPFLKPLHLGVLSAPQCPLLHLSVPCCTLVSPAALLLSYPPTSCCLLYTRRPTAAPSPHLETEEYCSGKY